MTLTSALLAAWLGIACGAGLRFYGAVAILGLYLRLGWVADLPGRLDVLTHPLLLGAASILGIIEFVADKTRRLNTAWDALHTFVRPPGAALLSFLLMSDHSMLMRLLAAAIGGGLAFAVHSTKASIRFVVNTRREPAMNIGMSLGEEATVLLLIHLALFLPIGALILVGLGVVVMGFVLPRVVVAFLRALNKTLDNLLAKTR